VQSAEKAETPEPPLPESTVENLPEVVSSPASAADFVASLDAKCEAFSDFEALETYWNDHVAPMIDGMFPPDQEECMGIKRKHERRLAP
jgi:hypothetical protein